MTTTQTTQMRESLPLGVRLIAGYYTAIAALFGALAVVSGGNLLSGNAAPFNELAAGGAVVYGVFGLLFLAIGIGLFRRQNWARIVALIFGLLSFVSIIGILIAIYLAKDSTARYFRPN